MHNTTTLIGTAIDSLLAILIFGFVLWLISFRRGDVSIVDSAWSLFQLIAAWIYFSSVSEASVRGVIVLTLVTVWALRLSIYITWRNWGHAEDYRYQQIRANNQPHFEWKALYFVFGLQGFLAWLLSMPVLVAIADNSPLNLLDALGILLFVTGFLFEAIGDFQLARFKKDATNKGKVMRTGLWRYTRHPNYFGEFCMAWGLYAIAVSAGGWWTLFAPLLITFLLLKISGVAMLEKDIGERRPDYRDYKNTTNAFFPGLPRRS